MTIFIPWSYSRVQPGHFIIQHSILFIQTSIFLIVYYSQVYFVMMYHIRIRLGQDLLEHSILGHILIQMIFWHEASIPWSYYDVIISSEEWLWHSPSNPIIVLIEIIIPVYTIIHTTCYPSVHTNTAFCHFADQQERKRTTETRCMKGPFFFSFSFYNFAWEGSRFDQN